MKKKKEDICREVGGVAFGTVRSRMSRYNETFDEALQFYARRKKIVVFGVIYRSYTDACKANNVPLKNVQYRVYNKNESYEESIKYLIENKPTPREVQYHGKKYDSMTSVYKSLGLDITQKLTRSIRILIGKGFSFEEALDKTLA